MVAAARRASMLARVGGLVLLAGVTRGFMEEGFTDGVDGGRYSLWQDEVKPGDERECKKAAEDIKCKVCEVILEDLLQGARMLSSADHIANILEGEPSEAEIEEAIAKRDDNLVKLAKGRRGCNRHFKDSFLRKGWNVEGCKIPVPDSEDPSKKRPPWMVVYGTCVLSDQPVQNETKMNTWSRRMESIYWACQMTVDEHRDELASFISKQVKKGERELKDIIKEACDRRAKCNKLKYMGNYAQREKEADADWKKQQMKSLELTKQSIKEQKKQKKKQAKEQVKEDESRPQEGAEL